MWSNTKKEAIKKAIPAVEALLEECCLCGHRCGVDRTAGKAGLCRTMSPDPTVVRYSSHTLHFGEEPMLVGKGGSGTVFFGHCNLRCVFCQNYQISQEGLGRDMSPSELAHIFLELAERGAENINLVTPTHYIYPILLALDEAGEAGLSLPIVYNTNGFESTELLALLDGVVDVYLPDFKYTDADPAQKYSSAKDYPDVAKAAILEMYWQVGPVVQKKGTAQSGLIIRHLVLPGNLSGTYDFLLWLQDEGLEDVTLSLMSQYSPQYRAQEFPELSAPLSHKEYVEVVQFALKLGFENLLTQGLDSKDVYLPDFREPEPFEQ